MNGRAGVRGLPQLVQFGLVGAAAAATHLACVWALVAGAGMAPLWANVLAFAVAFLVSYHGHARLTFGAARAPAPALHPSPPNRQQQMQQQIQQRARAGLPPASAAGKAASAITAAGAAAFRRAARRERQTL